MTDRIDPKETTMTTKQYNTEDFVNAEFARHPDGEIAARFDDDLEPWCKANGNWRSDTEMAKEGWVPVREAADPPITLDALRDAWETAEDADWRNAGDVLIRQHQVFPTADIEVWRSSLTGPLDSRTRILHRAPKREPWQDLADVLRAWDEEPMDADLMGRARWMHERGVRVTEEGEK